MADHGEVVRDHEVGQAELVLEVLEQVDDLCLDGHVQGAHRLVRDDQVGLHRQGPGNADALALTAGELVRVLAQGCDGQADGRHQLPQAGAGRRLVGVEAVGTHPFQEEGLDGLARVQAGERVLEHHLEALALRAQCLALQGGDVDAVEDDGAGGRRLEVEDGLAERGLAAAGLPDQAVGLTATDAQVDAVDGTHVADGPVEERCPLLIGK